MVCAQLVFSFLGGFQATRSDQPVAFATNAARALLAYLVTEAEHSHRRETVAGLLWPDQRQASAFTNLRSTLARLRKALPELDEANVLQVAPSSLRLSLNPSAVSTSADLNIRVDVAEFEDLLAECEVHDHPSLTRCPTCIQRLERAAKLYRGDFLSGFSMTQSQPFDEWIIFKREALHREALRILRILAEHFESIADYDRAQQYLSQHLALDPWQEQAHAQLMRVFALSGQRAAALQQYLNCQRMLREELGIAPSAPTTELYQRIQAETFPAPNQAAPSDPIALKTLAQPMPALSLAGWGEIPETGPIYGRAYEIEMMGQWVLGNQGEHRCQLISVLGLGGTGKTTLVAAVTRKIAHHFERVIWCSLINAPPLREILQAMLQTLSSSHTAYLPEQLNDQLALLMELMRQQRCLLILDNFESVVQRGSANAGSGYEAYSWLLRNMAEVRHQSCLLLTSREQPLEIVRLAAKAPRVRTLHLSGLDAAASQTLLLSHGLMGQPQQIQTLVEHYSGNPLALELVAQVVHDLFDSDMAAFLATETPIFDDIRIVLDQQYENLSDLEREILTWLAIERVPVKMATLRENLLTPVTAREFVEALRMLHRRSMIEQLDGSFGLQNVILEYVTDCLTQDLYQAILREHGEPNDPAQIIERLGSIHRFAMLKAEAKEYIRQTQIRLILQPVAMRLKNRLGPTHLAETLRQIVSLLREYAQDMPGYAAGNLLNLALFLGFDVHRMDFSHLAVWQALLQERNLAGVNFEAADLSHSVFTDTFSTIRSLAFVGDGELLATATSLGEIRLWHTATGQPVATLFGHSKLVMCVAAHPHERWLVSGGEDGTVRLWHIGERQPSAARAPHAATERAVPEQPSSRYTLTHSRLLGQSNSIIRAVAFYPYNAVVASAGDDTHIHLWNAETGQTIAVLQGHAYVITALAFSADGRYLASCSGDHTLCLWDVSGLNGSGQPFIGQAIFETPPQAREMWSLDFSPDSTLLAAGDLDGMVRMWDVRTLQLRANQPPMRAWQAHPESVVTLKFSRGGEILATGSDDGFIHLWHTGSGELRQTLRGHLRGVGSIALHPNDSLLASSSADRTLRIWDLRQGAAAQIIFGHSRPVTSLAIARRAKTLASGSGDGLVRLWQLDETEVEPSVRNITAATCRLELTGHTDNIWSVVIAPDDDMLASASEDRTIRLWQLSSGKPLGRLTGHGHIVTALAFSPTQPLLVSASIDQTLRLWNFNTCAEVAVLEGQNVHSVHNGIWSVAFSPDGQTIAAGYGNGAIALWDVSTHRIQQVLIGHHDWVRSLTYSADGSRLASASNDHCICLWDVATGKLQRELKGHSDWVMAVTFSPDGTLLASGGHDRIIRLWRVGDGVDLTGKEPLPCTQMVGHTNGIMSLAFGANGAQLISASQDETIKVWNVATHQCDLTLYAPGPYTGMNITGATGISESQRNALTALGAVVRSAR